MSFAYPWVLILLLCLPILMFLYWRRRGASGLEYSSLGGLDFTRKKIWYVLPHLPFILSLIVFTFLVLALARPQIQERHSKRSAEGLDILLTIDTSGSMEEEISYQRQWVTRLAAAKAVVNNFISQRPDDRIGLVVFGENAFTQAPLTLDHEVLQKFVENIYRGMAGNGTAIGSAILTSVKRMKDLESKSKVVILLTDGAQTAGSVAPEDAARAAKNLGVKIYTVGIGDRRSRSLDEETLKDIARSTGGQYFNAQSVEALMQVYETINRLETSKVEVTDYTKYHEKHHSYILAALSIFVLNLLLGMSRWRAVT